LLPAGKFTGQVVRKTSGELPSTSQGRQCHAQIRFFTALNSIASRKLDITGNVGVIDFEAK
jgi:hypothetical protein